MSKDIKNAECPNCIGSRSCDILFTKEVRWENEYIAAVDEFCVLQCRGCNNIFFQIIESSTEDIGEDGAMAEHIKYYPTLERVKRHNRFNDLFDVPLEKFESNLLEEIYYSINHDMMILAAMGIRALIDHIAVRLTGANYNYTRNIKNLVSKGYVSQMQKKILDAALEVGHGAVHRGHIPTFREVTLALDIAESMIETLLINIEKANGIIKTIPPRPIALKSQRKSGRIIPPSVALLARRRRFLGAHDAPGTPRP